MSRHLTDVERAALENTTGSLSAVAQRFGVSIWTVRRIRRRFRDQHRQRPTLTPLSNARDLLAKGA